MCTHNSVSDYSVRIQIYTLTPLERRMWHDRMKLYRHSRTAKERSPACPPWPLICMTLSIYDAACGICERQIATRWPMCDLLSRGTCKALAKRPVDRGSSPLCIEYQYLVLSAVKMPACCFVVCKLQRKEILGGFTLTQCCRSRDPSAVLEVHLCS